MGHNENSGTDGCRDGLTMGALRDGHHAAHLGRGRAFARPLTLAFLGLLVAVNGAVGAAAVAGASTAPRHASTAAGPALTPTLEQTLGGTTGSGHPGLYGWGVATMPDGTMAVGDIFNNRVVHYDTSGNLLGGTPAGSGILFKTKGLGANVYGIAVDPNDWTIYVGSAQCCGVQVWTTSSTTTLHYTLAGVIDTTVTNMSNKGTAKYPGRVAVGNDGTVYIADMVADTISVYSSHASGNVLEGSFGGFGKGPAQFAEPRGLALDGSNPQRLLVVDSANFRIQVFNTGQILNSSMNHGYIYSFGATGSPTQPYQFGGNLRGIAYDRARNLAYVVDIGKNRVEEFQVDPNATTSPPAPYGWVQNIGTADPNLATLTTCCAQPGYFSDGGREDAVDGNGNLWVGDMPNFRVQVWSTITSPPSSTFAFQAPDPSRPNSGTPWQPATGSYSYPEGVGVEADGTAWVSDSHNFRLQQLNTPANSYAFMSQQGIRGRQNAYGLAYARNISTNATNGVFAVADTYNNAVRLYQENGTPICAYGGNGTGGPDDSSAGAAASRTVSAAGGKIQSPLLLPAGVAIDNSTGPNNGDVYIADSGDHRVAVIDESCNYLGQIANNGTTIAFKDPRGDGVDPTNGDLYVSDFSGHKIYHFTISGSWTPTAATVTLANTITGSMSLPFDIQVDANYIYVSDTALQKILVFDKPTQAYDSASFTVPGQPEGISLAPNGNLYVASRSNDHILVYCLSSC